MKSNFRGRRYKCLICFDYDLCAECYESNATSTRHTTEHAVQCILTRSMLEVAYGSGSSSRQFQSFTCPYCGKKGFSDTTLLDHVTSEHSESAENSTMEVICPVCAASPGGEPNLKTDDLAEHLTLEHHRGGGGSTFEFINEPSAIRHGGVRRISRAAVGPGGVRSARRSNPNFSPSNQEPTDRESDLFAELQQTLAGGSRRQLQQLQMQIQMERQAIENRITNISRRPAGSSTSASGNSNANQASISIQRILSAMSNSGNARAETFMSSSPAARSQLLASVASGGSASGTHTSSSTGSQLSFIPAGIQLQGLHATQTNDAGSIQVPSVGGQFLMPRFLAPLMVEEDREQLERERSDR
jgi:E3 ubiquitin-protein ligase KCMF1